MDMRLQKQAMAIVGAPFSEHVKNPLDAEPRLPSSIYWPDAVADAIALVAENPQRDIFFGKVLKRTASTIDHAPRTLDRDAKRFPFRRRRVGAAVVRSTQFARAGRRPEGRLEP